MSRFFEEQMKIIEKHSRQSGRIRVLWESQSSAEAIKRSEAGIEFVIAIDKSLSYVSEGKFEQGLSIFKKAVVDYAEHNRRREDRLTQRLAMAAEDADVSAIVGYMGIIHTRISHILARQGYNVNHKYAEMENGLYVWGPLDHAIRHILFFPTKEPSELEWYRFMIGAAIHALYGQKTKDKSSGRMSGQETIRATRDKLTKLKDMESVERLRGAIRRRGIRAIFLEENS